MVLGTRFNKFENGLLEWAGDRCTLSPWVFNVFTDNVMKEVKRELVSEVRLIIGTI